MCRWKVRVYRVSTLKFAFNAMDHTVLAACGLSVLMLYVCTSFCLNSYHNTASLSVRRCSCRKYHCCSAENIDSWDVKKLLDTRGLSRLVSIMQKHILPLLFTIYGCRALWEIDCTCSGRKIPLINIQIPTAFRQFWQILVALQCLDHKRYILFSYLLNICCLVSKG